jgi:hypothetical protein
MLGRKAAAMKYVSPQTGKVYAIEEWAANDPYVRSIGLEKFANAENSAYDGCVNHVINYIKKHEGMKWMLDDSVRFSDRDKLWYIDAMNSIPLSFKSCTMFEVTGYIVACDGETCYCLDQEDQVVYNLAHGCDLFNDMYGNQTRCPELAKYLISLM